MITLDKSTSKRVLIAEASRLAGTAPYWNIVAIMGASTPGLWLTGGAVDMAVADADAAVAAGRAVDVDCADAVRPHVAATINKEYNPRAILLKYWC